uniref:(northern house mosquito) hypothetical protein n=1 Tax=Culex pipiens TaxID=7175 RepID=A0A8D8I2T9_CULPI
MGTVQRLLRGVTGGCRLGVVWRRRRTMRWIGVTERMGGTRRIRIITTTSRIGSIIGCRCRIPGTSSVPTRTKRSWNCWRRRTISPKPGWQRAGKPEPKPARFGCASWSASRRNWSRMRTACSTCSSSPPASARRWTRRSERRAPPAAGSP